jgi:hypothetical protein
MQVIATRDDVHPSDDPQPFNFEIADDAAPEEVLRRAADRTWLPSIRGDRATWSIVSNEVLAVLAYQWSDLKLMPQLAERMRRADRSPGLLRLHFNYHRQLDPDLVHEVLWGMQLRSSGMRPGEEAMPHVNLRVVITGAVLIGLAALFFLGMLTTAPKSNDLASMMRTVGQVAGAVGGLGFVMLIFGVIKGR